MSALISKIHVAKAQLGLHEDEYRALLRNVTGKESSAKMTRGEQIAVLNEFSRRGFRDLPASAKATGKYAPVLRALWLSAWNLGIARVKEDTALIAFVQRQTSVAHTRFLTDEQDARKAIEGLKAWIAREAGVKWQTGKGPLEAKRSVVKAQWDRLVRIGAVKLDKYFDENDSLTAYVGHVTRGYSRRLGSIDCPSVTAEELDKVQAALGKKLRAALAKTKGASQ